MNAAAIYQPVERFRSAITHRLGLQFDDTKLEFLRQVLSTQLEILKLSNDNYLQRLEDASNPADIARLGQELTICETYFFRNMEQFEALAEIVLPQRQHARANGKTLHILSAGCASGEEAYSIALVLRQLALDPGWRVAIRAVDLNPAALAKARRACFSTWALRATPPALQGQWFHPQGRESALDETTRKMVAFEERNLAAEDPELWQPGRYDVIFCRNVMMYFAPEQARALLARIALSLAPGGFLFLGHAETLRGLSKAFHLRHSHNTFYYERAEDTDSALLPKKFPPRPVEPVVSRSMPAAAVPSFGEAWFDVIQKANERVTALVAPHRRPRVSDSPAEMRRNMAGALDLLRRECFPEALAYVRDLPPELSRNPDALLLEAMLLAHRGDLVTAEAACRDLLAVDEFNAGAHYIMALCRESANDLGRAAEHDRISLYLDPGFAMPRLHLGLLTRRAGDRNAARRDLGQALHLLRSEDSSRILRSTARAVRIRPARLRWPAMTEFPASLGLASHATMLRRDFDRDFTEPRHGAAMASEDFLAIHLEAEPYAIRLTQITGLFADRKIIPVPGQASGFLGTAGFRGELASVYDLGVLMGYKPAKSPRWLVRVPPIALAFSRFDGHLRVAAGEIVPQAAGAPVRHHVSDFLPAQHLGRPIVQMELLLNTIRNQTATPAAGVGQ